MAANHLTDNILNPFRALCRRHFGVRHGLLLAHGVRNTMNTLNGTSYHSGTPKSMSELLERLRASGTRCRFHWGDIATGCDWGDIYGVVGRIGRSSGPEKILLLIHNIGSIGGGAIPDSCIVRIRHANRKNGGDIYCHPSYHVPRRAALSSVY